MHCLCAPLLLRGSVPSRAPHKLLLGTFLAPVPVAALLLPVLTLVLHHRQVVGLQGLLAAARQPVWDARDAEVPEVSGQGLPLGEHRLDQAPLAQAPCLHYVEELLLGQIVGPSDLRHAQLVRGSPVAYWQAVAGVWYRWLVWAWGRWQREHGRCRWKRGGHVPAWWRLPGGPLSAVSAGRGMLLCAPPCQLLRPACWPGAPPPRSLPTPK